MTDQSFHQVKPPFIEDTVFASRALIDSCIGLTDSSAEFGPHNIEESHFPFDSSDDPDKSSADEGGGIPERWKHHTHFVYDAAAERREEWLREGKLAMAMAQTVH